MPFESAPRRFHAPHRSAGLRGGHAPARREWVEVELAAGDAIAVGDVVCTVVEVDAETGEVHLRVDADGPAATPARVAVLAR